MLARSTRIRHPLGVTLQTPLLVPSFSSKALGFNKAGQSEFKEVFELASDYLTDIMLVSAFDLAYGHLEPITRAITDVAIIDSGGYEVSGFQDFSAVSWEPPGDPKQYRKQDLTRRWSLFWSCLFGRTQASAEWSEEKLCEVYRHWPEHIPAILVSFDRPDLRYPLQTQIERARRLFSNFPNQMHTLLVKPESESQAYIQAENVIVHVEALRNFDIIGFTEKELGDSVLDRMESVANIRLAMNDAGLSIPIHVYGSLDPITSVLYFLAGAEMFDGLTWIRYGYADGFACYYHNYSARKIGIAEPEEFVRAKTRQDNLGYLLDLKYKMQKFLLDGDFKIFGGNAELLSESYALLQTKNRRIR